MSLERKYLFIVGCTRSGTTALWTLMTSHPKTAIGLERYIHRKTFDESLFHKDRFFQLHDGDTYYKSLSDYSPYYDRLKPRYDACHVFGDKSNKLYSKIEHIRSVLPAPRFLFIIQNIFDVPNSYNVHAAKNEATWPQSRNYARAITDWNESLKYAELLEQGDDGLVINYEDLIFGDESPGQWVEKLADFTGIDPRKEMIQNLTNLLNRARQREREQSLRLSSLEKQEICRKADFERYQRITGSLSNSEKPPTSAVSVPSVLDASKTPDQTIKKIQIFGERCSGTNYLENLLLKNIKNVAICRDFGWKHFFHKGDMTQAEDCLFIILYRDPLDWLRSLHRQPYHAAHELRGIVFSQFIRRPWWCIWDEESDKSPNDPIYGKEMMMERSPDTGERFPNVMKMRAAKIRDWESLREKTQHNFYIRYEDLKENPTSVIESMSATFGLQTDPTFQNVEGYRGGKAKFQPKTYDPIKPEDQIYIKKELDTTLENKIGYDLSAIGRSLPPAKKKLQSYDSFIFTHIPRCGGTSFRKFIYRSALKSRIDPEKLYIPGYNNLDENKNIIGLPPEEIDVLKKRELKILACHAQSNVHLRYGLKLPNPFYYVLFREPISRCISHYSYFYFKKGYRDLTGMSSDLTGMSLNDLETGELEKTIKNQSNLQVRYLANLGRASRSDDDEALSKAIDILQNDYACFGILEHIDESIRILRSNAPAWLRWEPVFPRTNSSDSTDKASAPVIEMIQHYNRYDIELYNYALTLFIERGKES